MEWLVVVGVFVVLVLPLLYFWRPRGRAVEDETVLYDAQWMSDGLRQEVAERFATGSGYGPLP